MIDRRALLSGAAALPLAAVPALSTSVLAAAVDPIFAAIEKHRAAEAAFVAACEPCGKVVGDDPPHLEAARNAASDAEIEARYDMHETVPQTIAGLAAYVAYWNQYMSPPRPDGVGQLDEIGWEAIPTIAEAMGKLFPAA